MKKVLRSLLGVLVVGGVLAAYGWGATTLESQRLETPLPHAAAGTLARRLDPARMLADVRTLASAEFEGRRTGTAGSRKAQAFIEARFRELGLEPVGASYRQPFSFTRASLRGLLSSSRPFRTEYPSATNVLAQVRGTREPDRYLVVSAHYDHLGVREGRLYAGADDNASGVAALLSLAAYFAQHPPAHSILFAAFDAEELGLRGAKAFLEAPPVPRAQLVANLNLDMVSRNDAHRIFVAGTHQNPALRPLVERAAQRRSLDVFLGHDRPMFLAGTVEDWTDLSDHGAFHARGIPFLYVGVEDHADYHAPTDTAERIDPIFFGEVGELILELALGLDQGPAPASST